MTNTNFFKASDLDKDVVERNLCGHCKRGSAPNLRYFCEGCEIEMQIMIDYDGRGNYKKVWIDYLADV